MVTSVYTGDPRKDLSLFQPSGSGAPGTFFLEKGPQGQTASLKAFPKLKVTFHSGAVNPVSGVRT